MSPARLCFAGLALLILPCAAEATAQQEKAAADFRATFLRLDANGDTVIERDEVPEPGREAFDRLVKRGDANRNGKLEADEVRGLGQKLRALGDNAAAGAGAGAGLARFKAMDKDGDGQVTRAEFSGPAPLFDRLDADKDGSLTKQEAAKFARANADAPAPKPEAPGTAKPKKPEAEAGAVPPRFKAMDKDGDGKVSKSEFPREKLFDRLDADKDGFLTPAELRKAAKPAEAKTP